MSKLLVRNGLWPILTPKRYLRVGDCQLAEAKTVLMSTLTVQNYRQLSSSGYNIHAHLFTYSYRQTLGGQRRSKQHLDLYYASYSSLTLERRMQLLCATISSRTHNARVKNCHNFHYILLTISYFSHTSCQKLKHLE